MCDLAAACGGCGDAHDNVIEQCARQLLTLMLLLLLLSLLLLLLLSSLSLLS